MRVNITPHPTKQGAYYLDYRPEGSKGKRKRIPVDGYENALAQKEIIEQHFSTPAEVCTHPRIKDVYEEYLAWVKREQAPATHNNKKIVFEKVIVPHFGEYRVRQLTQRIYDEFQAKLEGKRRAIILYQAYLGGLIKWMTKRKMADPLPFRPENPKWHRPIKTIPHPSDLDKVIAAITDEAKRVMFQLMLLTGIRWNEASHIEWRNVDTKTKTIRLTESIQEANDLIVIPDCLLEWFKVKKTFSGWVFPNPRTQSKDDPIGKPYGSLKKCLANACEKAGVKITPHLFRHASATYLYEATGDIYAVQHHLRHKDVKTSQIYTQFSTDRKRKGQAALIVHMDNLKKAAKPRRTKVDKVG